MQNKNKTQNEIVLKTYFQSFQRAMCRSELNHDEILQLSKNGLAKSPSLLYTFYTNQVDEDDQHQRVRPLIELNDNKLHRGGYRYVEYIDGTNGNDDATTKDHAKELPPSSKQEQQNQNNEEYYQLHTHSQVK